MQQLDAALNRFVEQHDLYNEAYGLFKNHDLRPREQHHQPEVDARIPLSPELQYLYSHYEMMDAKAEGTLKMKSVRVMVRNMDEIQSVIYSVSREDASRSGMNKLAGSTIYKYMTIRNVNTTRQIYKLMQAVAEK